METIRYSPIGKEDLGIGQGSYEVTLADGRVVMLGQINLDILEAGGSSKPFKLLNQDYYPESSYSTFAAAVSAAGSSIRTLAIPRLETITANVTVPTTLTLLFTGTGQLSINTGVTVTINGPVIAGDAQIFAAAGTVTYGSGALARANTLASWWGKTDAGINAAIVAMNAGGGGTVTVTPGSYIKAGGTWVTITLLDHVRLVGPLQMLGERTGQTGKGAVLLNNDIVNTITYATAGDATLSTAIEGLSFESSSASGVHLNLAGIGIQNRTLIRGNSLAGKLNHILIGAGSYDLWIERNSFYQGAGHQIWSSNSSASGSLSLIFRDNYFSNQAAGFSHIRFDGTAAFAGVEISNNVFAGGTVSTAPLVDIAGSGGVRALVVRSNDFENFSGAAQVALSINGGNATQIEGNTMSSGVTAISLLGCVGTVLGGNRFGTLTGNALTIDAASSETLLLPNSAMTPIGDSSTTTMTFGTGVVTFAGHSLALGKTGAAIDFSAVAAAVMLAGSTNLIVYDSAGSNPLLTINASGIAPRVLLQANLGAPANGTIVYCSDCTIANPCAGGGTGAIAKRLNGAWVCN